MYQKCKKIYSINFSIMKLKRYISISICLILIGSIHSQVLTVNAEEKNTNSNSIQSMATQSNGAGELHAFYPSNAIYSEQIQKYIDNVDSLSFAWSQIEAEDTGNLNIEFYYPDDYQQPVKYAKSKGKSIQLSIYMNGSDGTKLLPYKDKRQAMEKAILDSMQKDITQGGNIFYDGVVIDFEGLRNTNSSKTPLKYEGKQISTYFTQFLKELKTQLLPSGKKLYVAVNQRLYYDGYNYKEILGVADRIILMAHDYETSEKLSKDQIQQYTGYGALEPIYSPAPIQMVRKALNDIKAATSSSSELSKVWLQIAFDSAQWQFNINGADAWAALDGSSLSREGRRTPLYKAIKDRADNADGNGKNLTLGYNNELQSPYIQYYNTIDKSWNVILYEDSISISAKIDLAKEFGLGGISVWSLGNLPDFNDTTGKAHHLNGWSVITDKMKSFHIQSADSKKHITFSDKAIEKAVREKLGKSTGKITVADVNKIYRLKLRSGVKSLNDIKKLKNLEYLDAQQLNISDIKALKAMTKLKYLNLANNKISDIQALKSLTGLELLYLQRNSITDIKVLSVLKNLKELSLNGNKISDIKPVSGLDNLEKLYLKDNKIKNVTPLKGLINLKELYLKGNSISSYSPLKDLYTKLHFSCDFKV